MKTSLILSTLFLAIIGSIFAGVLGVNPMIGAAAMQIMQIIPMPLGIMGMNALTSKVLIEQREAFDAEMLGLHNTAKAENRLFNDDEKTKYDKAKEEREKLVPQIKELEEREAIEEREARHAIGETEKKKEEETIRNYSFMNVLRSVGGNKPLAGFEAEMDQEARKQAIEDGVALSGNGIVIPRMIIDPNSEKRDMTAGTAGEGGYAVPTEISDFIGYLGNKLVLTELGADFMPGLKGKVKFPTEASVAAATWEGETDDGAETSPTVGTVDLTPKRLGTYTDISNLLLLQTSSSVEARVRRQFVNAIKTAIEAAAINGSGTAPIPEGILNVTGIGSVAGGTNGLAAAWSHIVGLESAVAAANADVGKMGYLLNAVTRGALKTTPKVASTETMIWESILNTLNGYKTAVTNAVPSDLTKGTSEDVCSAIIFGNFADLLIGMWSGMEIIADPYSQATNGMLRLVINTYADVAVGHAGSFAAMKDVLTA